MKSPINNLIKISTFAFLLLLIPYPNAYFKDVGKGSKVFTPVEFNLPDAPPVPILKSYSEPPPEVTTAGVFIIDIPSNVVIYEKKSREKFYPASTTKIMTALLAVDYFKPDDVLKVKTVITEGRTMGLREGEKLTFESLLYGILVHSANDAAYTIAENYPQGIKNFVSQMNAKAKQMYLSDTNFENPIGFDDPNHYTTARDLAKIAQMVSQNKILSKIVATKSITVSDISYTHFYPLFNVNELLGRVPGVSGIKTGFTDTAGEILVSEVRKNGHDVLFVALKSRNRFGESESLIKWVFDNFTWEDVTFYAR